MLFGAVVRMKEVPQKRFRSSVFRSQTSSAAP
jgi:hypothetical protein